MCWSIKILGLDGLMFPGLIHGISEVMLLVRIFYHLISFLKSFFEFSVNCSKSKTQVISHVYIVEWYYLLHLIKYGKKFVQRFSNRKWSTIWGIFAILYALWFQQINNKNGNKLDTKLLETVDMWFSKCWSGVFSL